MPSRRTNCKPMSNRNRRHVSQIEAYDQNGIYVKGDFFIWKQTEKAWLIEFRDYLGKHWIPKSQIADERYGIGRTPPRKGNDLCVVSTYFSKKLRKKLKRR
jgi:hypothetical protein